MPTAHSEYSVFITISGGVRLRTFVALGLLNIHFHKSVAIKSSRVAPEIKISCLRTINNLSMEGGFAAKIVLQGISNS